MYNLYHFLIHLAEREEYKKKEFGLFRDLISLLSKELERYSSILI